MIERAERRVLVLLAVVLLVGAPPAASEPNEQLAAEVRQAEVAFAKTMADRDHDAFASYVSDEAVFVSEGHVLRGKSAVVKGWAPFFEGPEAPFSWKPDLVEVLDSGRLALSSGPVLNAQGQRVGTFNSIWRREADDRWRVVFDKGCGP